MAMRRMNGLAGTMRASHTLAPVKLAFTKG
jgi:hypothetical protein